MSLSPVYALAEAYMGLRPETLPALLGLYAPEARFKDPFNERPKNYMKKSRYSGLLCGC